MPGQGVCGDIEHRKPISVLHLGAPGIIRDLLDALHVDLLAANDIGCTVEAEIHNFTVPFSINRQFRFGFNDRCDGNHIERMDPAVLRAGRMDLKIQVPMPDAEALLAMLRAHLSEYLADADMRDLSHQAVGCSAADLDAAIRSARSDARHARKRLTLSLLRQHLGISTAAVNESVIYRVAVHEAGHAIAGAALQFGAITSMQVTANGGMILRQPHMHHSLIADIEAEIVFSLAGRAAERLVFGEVSTGAGGHKNSDLAKATRWALEIETTYGLGSLGPVWHAKPEDVHLTNAHIRDKVRHRIDLAEKRAGKILGQNRDVLEALARELARKRSLRAADIEPFLSGVSRGPEAKPATTTEETTP